MVRCSERATRPVSRRKKWWRLRLPKTLNLSLSTCLVASQIIDFHLSYLMTSTFPDSLIPGYDAARLRTLHQFQIVNTTPEPIFDSYVTWIAQLFNAPIALISLVDTDYVWFKALTGVDGVAGLPRNE